MAPLLVIAVAVLVGIYAVLFAVSTLAPSGAFAAKSRLGVIVGAANAMVAMMAAHVFLPWATVPTGLWLVPVAVIAGGVAGAVLRWGSLPTYRPGARVGLQLASAVLQLAVAIVIGVVLLLL